MKRMKNAVEFNPKNASENASESTSNYWQVVIQLLVFAGSFYYLYKFTKPLKIIINHYHLPMLLSGEAQLFTKSKNPNQNTVAQN